MLANIPDKSYLKLLGPLTSYAYYTEVMHTTEMIGLISPVIN